MLDKSYIEEALSRFAKAVIKQSRANLTRQKINSSNKLYKSLENYKINVSKNSFQLTFSMEDYGDYIDLGVKGTKGTKDKNRKKHDSNVFERATPFSYKTKMPPTKSLDKWMVKKGLKGTRNEKGQFIKRKNIAFAVAKSIYNYGIPQSLFFTKPFEREFKRLPEDIIEQFGLDVDKFLNTTNDYGNL